MMLPKIFVANLVDGGQSIQQLQLMTIPIEVAHCKVLGIAIQLQTNDNFYKLIFVNFFTRPKRL